MLPASTVWLSPDLDRIMHRAIIILLIILVNRCLWFHCLTKLSLSGSEIFQLKNLVKDFLNDIFTFVLLFLAISASVLVSRRCVSFLGFSSYNWLYSAAWGPLHSFFYKYFLASGGGSPLYAEILQSHNDPAAHQDHSGRCRIRTRDLCPRSLARYQWATTSTKATVEFCFLVRNASFLSTVAFFFPLCTVFPCMRSVLFCFPFRNARCILFPL